MFAIVRHRSEQPVFSTLFPTSHLCASAAVRYNPTNWRRKFCGIGRTIQHGGTSPKSLRPTHKSSEEFVTQKLNRLTARKVATETKLGLHADGGGLYLRVGRGGAKSWCLRYMLQGKAREMGLGGLLKVSLAEARRRAAAQRLLLVDKIDPLKKREAENSAKKIKAARSITFGQCAKAYIDSHAAGWRNAKHAQQWTNTLATYVYPTFGSVAVADVDVAMIMKALRADLGCQARNRWTGAGSNRGGARLGEGTWLSRWREPGALAWASV
jgi:hypothetical protein